MRVVHVCNSFIPNSEISELGIKIIVGKPVPVKLNMSRLYNDYINLR